MSESFAQMFEESVAQTNMRVGEIITGEVVDINRDVVIVNAGLKSEGVIPVEQFYNDTEGNVLLAVGDYGVGLEDVIAVKNQNNI